MSFWDELKELFKTDDERDEERRRRLQEASEGTSELEKQLAALDAKWQKSLPKQTYDLDALFPKKTGLEEIDYTPRTDEDILDAAQKEIDYQKAVDKDKAQSKYETSSATLEKSKQAADENLKKSYQNLEKVYDELRAKAENDAIKRGIARSSIIMSKLGDLDYAKMLSAGEVEKAYNDTVGDIDLRLRALENDRDVAMGELDLKYADELAKRIADLKQERDELTLKYEKYNNTVREKNAKYESERETQISKFLQEKEKEQKAQESAQAEHEKKYGYSGDKLTEYQHRYDLAYEFYTSLSPDIAVDALKSAPNMKYYLGLYYDKLLNALKIRAKSAGTNKLW